MRCEKCGRPMMNAELWQLAGDPNAPTSSSMRHLCWECRNQSAKPEERNAGETTGMEPPEAVQQYTSSQP
ncbi:MAG: hypothetical protein ACRDHP_13415 [Ktedonobacterales bacterium]